MITDILMYPKVAFISQPEYFRFIYEDDLSDVANVLEVPFHYNMKVESFRLLEEFDAEFNFFFRGEYFPEEILQRLRGIKINFSSEPFPRHINGHLEFTRDSYNRYLHFRGIRYKGFDYVFHYDESSLAFMSRDGLHLSGAFPFPVATERYRQLELEKTWDIFFIGRSTTHREKHFSHLKHNYNFLHIAHGIWGQQLVDYVNKSSICLNIHAENEISWEPRMQIFLASGAFVISEKITPNPILRPGIHFIEISSPHELHEAVEYYLNNPTERFKIAECGCRHVRDFLDSKKVFKSLLKSIEEGKVDRFSTSSGRALFDFLQLLSEQTRKLKNIFK